MKQSQRTEFTERLKTAAEARKALLAGFQPKPTVTAPGFTERAVLRAAELEQVRRDRVEAKAAKKLAAAEAAAQALQAAQDVEAAALDMKRGERKERKALSKAEAKEKRDARYAARKARQ
jgi:hypothetical protein